jgi:hypothetical protein
MKVIASESFRGEMNIIVSVEQCDVKSLGPGCVTPVTTVTRDEELLSETLIPGQYNYYLCILILISWPTSSDTEGQIPLWVTVRSEYGFPLPQVRTK